MDLIGCDSRRSPCGGTEDPTSNARWILRILFHLPPRRVKIFPFKRWCVKDIWNSLSWKPVRRRASTKTLISFRHNTPGVSNTREEARGEKGEKTLIVLYAVRSKPRSTFLKILLGFATRRCSIDQTTVNNRDRWGF